MATRARAIALGEAVIKAIQAKKTYLIIIADDCGNNMKKKLLDKCQFYNIPYIFISASELEKAIGKENRKAVAILEKGFAISILKHWKG